MQTAARLAEDGSFTLFGFVLEQVVLVPILFVNASQTQKYKKFEVYDLERFFIFFSLVILERKKE